MALVKKHWFQALLLVLALGGLYAGTRLLNLTKLPIFTDEAIYIRWSQIGGRDAAWRFISLSDGKQPLFTWLMMISLRVFSDPLFAGRLVSVGAGALSSVGMGLLGWELFRDKRVGLVSSIFYILSPFGLMYDRLALYDSLVATFFIWNLLLAVRLVRLPRLDTALLLGMGLGLGMLNKTSGFLSLYLLPVTLILFDLHASRRLKRLMQWVFLIGIAALISQLMYGILRLSPLFHMIGQKDAVFVYSFREWFSHPFTFLEGNLKGLFDWLVHYLTPPVFIAALVPLFTLWRQGREKLLVYAYWFLPFLALALFGRVLYPRFILFMSMPLLILSASSIVWLWHYRKTLLGSVTFALLFLPSLLTDYFIIVHPLYAPIPYADRGQLIENWPSGWGVSEVNAFLLARSQQTHVTVYTEGTFGLLPAAIEIYLIDKPNIEIYGIWPLPKEIPQKILDSTRTSETYFVLNQSQEVPYGWPLSFIAEYQKGTREDRKLRFYKVIVPPSSKL